MSEHWDALTDECRWIVPKRKRVSVGPLGDPGAFRLSPALARLFPRLAKLLRAAHTTPVRIGADEFTLFSWVSENGISTWLSPRPPARVPRGLFPAHAKLLREFGGVSERSGDFTDSWLLDTNDSLTASEGAQDATFISAYEWAFARYGGRIPIDLRAHYSISREASMNTTLCHRTSGAVLLFAPDHAYDHVTVLEGCPPYSLYRLNGAPNFRSWVETVARQWLGICSVA